MIHLAARQLRAAAIVAATGLLAVLVIALVTRPHLVTAAATARRACGDRPGCAAWEAVAHLDAPLRTALGLLVILVPALIGAFWGAPLVAHEYETGTYRLVWTQSIPRTRWLAVKLAVADGTAVVTVGLLSALVTWWAAPVDRAAAGAYGLFDQRDIAPIGYAAFAFALGVVAGLVCRRTLPAMAITLFGVLAVRIVVTRWIRPLPFGPRVSALALDPDTTGYGSGGTILFGIPKPALQPQPPDIPNAWIRSVRIVDAAGHPLSDSVLHATCPGIGSDGGSGAGSGAGSGGGSVGAGSGGHVPVPAAVAQRMHDCVTRIGATYHEAVTYQPAGRYWAFQWWELGVYLAVTAVLLGYAYLRLRRRA